MAIADTLFSAHGTPPTEELSCAVCVVGGGMAGLCAALAAAREGAEVVLLQDRAVLGGNASSEVRMWICGAHGADNKETGILEELQLENLQRNPGLNYPLWDGVLYGKAAYQPRLRLVLSAAVVEVEMAEEHTGETRAAVGTSPAGGTAGTPRIAAVRAWHLTRQCWIRVRAEQFIDCSGDAVLRWSGAACRWGREAQATFQEAHAPAVADRKTMGNSLLLQLRESDPARHRPFVAPPSAKVFDDQHPRVVEARPQGDNFWWLEIGGESDTQADADRIRDELLRIAYGVWSFIKNHPDGRGRGWELEWIGMLPGKRENVRYVGDHMLSQQDIEGCGQFEDLIGHGGWSMDDHHPAGFRHPGAPTIFHPAPSPYGLPLRILYSRDISNLLCAGRNASCSHMAMSSTRVMATCAVMGQAAGTTAALAVREHTTARGVLERHLVELQNRLLDADQWLPDRRRQVPALCREARLEASSGSAQAELLRDGLDRRCQAKPEAWSGPPGATITYSFAEARYIARLRLVGDSQLHRQKRMPCSWPQAGHDQRMPAPLIRDLVVECQAGPGAQWQEVARISDNALRLLRIPVGRSATALRVRCLRAWGESEIRIFSCEIGEPQWDAPHQRLAWPVPKLSGSAHA